MDNSVGKRKEFLTAGYTKFFWKNMPVSHTKLIGQLANSNHWITCKVHFILLWSTQHPTFKSNRCTLDCHITLIAISPYYMFTKIITVLVLILVYKSSYNTASKACCCCCCCCRTEGHKKILQMEFPFLDRLAGHPANWDLSHYRDSFPRKMASFCVSSSKSTSQSCQGKLNVSLICWCNYFRS